MALLLLVPGGLSDPVQGETSIRADLDGSRLSLPDRLLHGLHQVLSIVDQHLGGLSENKLKYDEVVRILRRSCDQTRERRRSPAQTPLH